MKRKYMPSISQLIDRLCMVSLKSIHIDEHKVEYEKEAAEIMHDIDLLLGKKQGQFIRAASMNRISELVGGRKDFKLDYIDSNVCKEHGYNFDGVFDV